MRLTQLQQSMIVDASVIPINFELSVDKIVEWVAKSKLIPEHEVTITAMTK